MLRASLLALLTVAIYWPAMHSSFVYDDAHFVLNNDVARHGAFTIRTDRPLTLASYWLNFHTTGENPLYFHLTNLAIHLINGLLVFLAAQSVFGLSEASAVLAGGVFLLHPLASEAVVYISGRSELLATVFILLSVLLFAKSRYVLAGIAMFLAIASKEIGLLTPALWWITAKKRSTWHIAAFAVVGVLISPLRAYLGVIWQNAHLSGCYAILSLLARAVLPIGLSVDHDFTSQPWIFGLLAAWLIGLAVFIALVARARGMTGGLAFLWIAALTLPHVLVEPPGYFTEHHMYAPLLGIAIILASILTFNKGVVVYEQF